MPLFETVIFCVVAAFDHRYDAPAVAVSVTLPPVQKLVGPLAVIVGENAPTLTVVVPVAVQLLALVTVTDNEMADEDAGANVMLFVFVAPVIVPLVIVHAYVLPATLGTDAVAVLPAHILAGALIVALGAGFTVTTNGADVALQPDPFATRTV